MQNSQKKQCLVCCEQIDKDCYQLDKCKHIYCISCLKQYIDTLKQHNSLTAQKLSCLVPKCEQQLPDNLINKIYSGEQGFILCVVRKKYKQSKDSSVKIFNCKGFMKKNRQPLVDKPSTMARQVHTKLMNQKVKNIINQQQIVQDKKILNTKEKLIQCYVCGVSYCPQCEDFSHQGKCQIKQEKQLFKKFNKNNQNQNNEHEIQAFLQANSMAKCLNPKCGLPIQKQQGCFWVKCRCSWQFCYPCKKLWGDCQHFAKYPYKKFTPPPEWMIKALNLY